jgi:virginiamycin A acetyltransferase
MPFDPLLLHPHRLPDGSPNRCIVHLPRAIAQGNVTIGDFTYANDFDPPDDWRARLAPYLYPGAPERLVIGRYGQIAHGVRFITASANHPMDGVSTYPFPIFDAGLRPLWQAMPALPDTVIGHDVWIGHGAIILPGARIGHGVIIGAGAVVGGTVPDFAVVAGNPARILRMRFSPADSALLLTLAWWDWPPEAVRAALPVLTGGAPADLAPWRSRPD